MLAGWSEMLEVLLVKESWKDQWELARLKFLVSGFQSLRVWNKPWEDPASLKHHKWPQWGNDRSKLSASPSVSYTGAIDRLHRIEANESVQPLDESKELTLIPERISLNISAKEPESGHSSITGISERTTQFSVLNKTVPISEEDSITRCAKDKEKEDKLQSLFLSSSLNSKGKLIKPSSKVFGFNKQGLRNKNNLVPRIISKPSWWKIEIKGKRGGISKLKK